MQVTRGRRRSGAAMARRRQIIEATIVAVAEVGYQRASSVEVARRAGISNTRRISFHFEDRAELMGQVAVDVIGGWGPRSRPGLGPRARHRASV